MSNITHDMMGEHRAKIPFPDVAAGGASNYIAMWVAPYKCKYKVNIWFTDAVSGNTTNRFNLNLKDDAQTSEVANKDFSTGVDGAVGTAIALLSTNTNINADEAIYLQRELVSGGLATPFGIMEVVYYGM